MAPASIRFVLVGGFLGAGKTTMIARLARAYQARGLKVGVVTNDQAEDLVDTQNLRSQGFEVGEVAGACFCCKFDDLTATIERLAEAGRPDVVIAEPVGSCTDLVATVMQPIRQMYGEKFSLAPYVVLLKPSHGLRILRGAGGFSPKAEYIFRKQLEEADVVFINRTDEISPSEVSELERLVQQIQPGLPVLKGSAKTGSGEEPIFAFLDQQGDFGRRILDIDYDVYAEGEAELGWLNATYDFSAPHDVPLDDVLTAIVDELRTSLDKHDAETAHLKVIGLADEAFGVANLVSRYTPAESSARAGVAVRAARLVVNARAATSPDELTSDVRAAVAAVAAKLGATIREEHLRAFRPGRPEPTHRVSNAV